MLGGTHKAVGFHTQGCRVSVGQTVEKHFETRAWANQSDNISKTILYCDIIMS